MQEVLGPSHRHYEYHENLTVFFYKMYEMCDGSKWLKYLKFNYSLSNFVANKY